MKRFLPKQKIWWVVIVLVLIGLGVGGYFAYQNFWAPTNEIAEEETLQTSVARRGSLTIYASAAGVVIANKEISLGFDESGIVAEILVSTGEEVETGQVLARLQTENTEESIAVAVSNAEIAVINAQDALDDIYDSWDKDVALAMQTVANAQQAMEDAEVAYNRANLTASQATIDTEYADLLIARQSLEKAAANFEEVEHRPTDDLERAQRLSALSSAQQSYDTAAANYNAALSTGDETEVAIAEADLALAKAELAEAQRAYERIKDAPDPEEITLAEAELENAQLQLASAKEEQVYVDLVAPFDGTILEIDAIVGGTVGSSAIITLADLSIPLLEIYLDESDLDKVTVGNSVEVVFDALPDETFTGKIVEVEPSLQSVSNVSTVVARVELDAESLGDNENLVVGLNATVDVIAGEAENAILIPVEALREIDTDEYAVFVIENNQPRLRMVTVALQDYTTAAITSGLDAGDVVSTGLVETE
ncbi:MAG: efflux RND transporter periplasmic adaptor subunit [Anaerolineales bacterium]|nr:efflux RND transporter periplasmic adaptor subunit [Anaerolineales bacterium]